MKNKLAENLLRFGIKNLNESEIAKLQGLVKEDASSRNAFIAALAKLDPKAADVVKNQTAGVTVGDKYVLNYVPRGEDQRDGGGTLHMYKVGISGGIPVIQNIGQASNKAGTSSHPNDISLNRLSPLNLTMNDAGDYNEVWNSLDNQKTQDVINGAFQFIGNNLEKFKKAFHQVTRSEYAIKNWWGDNPQTVNRSQYGMWRNKYEKNARTVINRVQDDELMGNIRFKVKNWRNDGKYPELKPPSI